MLLVFTLSFVKLMWLLSRYLSCTHDHDSRTPRNKNANSHTESYAKTCHPSTKNNKYSIHVLWSLSKFPKGIWAIQKNIISMPKGMREKGVQRCPPKKREKKHSPPSPYFLEKNEIHDKGVQKENRIRKYSTHLHILIKVYALHLLGSSFWLSNIMWCK